MITTLPLVHDLLADADGRAGHWHGEDHWRAVAQAGWHLAKEDLRVDRDVMFLFAVLHDSRRENELADPDHGPRAAARFSAIEGRLGLSRSQASILLRALRIHTGSGSVSDPTVGACLDADRLNLWRVGHEPDPALLSTRYAKRPEVIAWSRGLCARWSPAPTIDVPIMDWPELVSAYRSLAP